ncbi:MAG TPA: hypothetical protein VG269_09115 [Tepidisphaeraceae bacterium]|jgi:hypothetical protein|nr:hypothetical protein [Tepidisphaeraceae bacterium]
MRAWLLLLPLLFLPSAVMGGEPAGADAKYPFRTDDSNAQLPWYRLKHGEFPPFHSEHRVTGELVDADFIHRCGQFRDAATGELVDFKLLPCGTVRCLNAGGDLRDVPLGTSLQFSLYQDESGAFTKAAAVEDDFSQLAVGGMTYRLDEAHLADGRLAVTKQNLAENHADLGHADLSVNERTRVWKGEQRIKLADLAAGDLLLANFTGSKVQKNFACADIWVGADTQKAATARQRKRHTDFLKERGLPGWIERVEGKRLSVTLFGEPDDLQAIMKAEGIDPGRSVTEHRRVHAVVANQDLRSYNPPVDGQGSNVVEFKEVPTDRFGCSGICWVIEPNLLLEGFRKGRVIRLFAHPSWPVRDMPFGEGVYTEVPNSKVEEESANQYPFRTDFGNAELPWYQLKAGEFPPYQSHHLMSGELVKADASHRTGQFRADRTGELVDFTMPPFGAVLYHNAGADLGDLPTGAHYFFYLHQDQKGAFTRATLITDDFTSTANERFAFRLDAANLETGILELARQYPTMKDDKEHLMTPPDIGRGQFAVDDKTRVWKGDEQIKLSDLAAGDMLLMNLTGRIATTRGRCTEIWVGTETHKKATEQQRAKHSAVMREQGLPAWVDRVEGKEVTITFFAANRRDFPAILDGDPWGKPVQVIAVDEELHPHETPLIKMGFKNHLPEGDTEGTYGCSGIRWVLESQDATPPLKQGQIIRLWKEGWPVKPAEAKANP